MERKMIVKMQMRLSPPYLFVIGVAEVGMRWQLNGSVFEPRLADGVNCAKYWWRNALYINSLFPRSEMCMLWSWYMANDTQFYALGIILLLIAVRHFRFAAVAGLVFLASSWITTAVIAVQYEYHVSIPDPFALFDQLYDKPWLRLGPYMIGMFTGWLLYETSFQIRLPKVHVIDLRELWPPRVTVVPNYFQMAVISGWVLAICCMGALVYGVALVGRPVPPFGGLGLSVMGSAAYASFGHTAWAIAVAWVIVACATGNGGWISGLLCWSVLRPLSRLAYCAYLVHPVVMVLTAFRMDGPLHLETSIVVCRLALKIAYSSFKLQAKLIKA
ncbi:hypothetical protein J437_LFUL012694 [Ladona fulva]|uniref:Acyltransferase 3 domain-containing protein n=1 Tax=Ladona fulva TaxID=123851 RepID=A0A8K0JZ61_LADFU|nr:hypothetical protein J437_LFUL012694 [Ladona fulva]